MVAMRRSIGVPSLGLMLAFAGLVILLTYLSH